MSIVKFMRVKYLLVLMIVMLFFVLTGQRTVHAKSTIVLENKSDILIIYMIYWIDHDWEVDGRLIPYPVNIMGGELKAGEVSNSSHEYSPGHYIIRWYPRSITPGPVVMGKFEIKESYHTVTITYSTSTVQFEPNSN
jgi:hypothetical protein